MIDIHAHVLYGIDDGAKSIEESIAILKKMSELGYEKVIATPHYIENTDYIADNKKKKEVLDHIKRELKKENISLELYLGNEIFIDEDLLKKMVNQEIYTLHNTNYILLELPLVEKFEYAMDVIYELIRQGVYVILAHPERYHLFQKNEKLIDAYLEMGVLLQGNVDSLDGKYGKKAQKLFMKLLKKRKYFVLASDIHRENSSFFDNFQNNKKKIMHYTDENYVKDLFEQHPQMILNNSNLEKEE